MNIILILQQLVMLITLLRLRQLLVLQLVL
nr:MAG TPA: hypothetical protein [Caudoviricetes sp.]DAN16851.1 MAG TPA: hypothetical protein [Bacteriophage sp.]